MNVRFKTYLILVIITLFFLSVSNLEAKKQSLKGRAAADYRGARISLQQENYEKALGQYLSVLTNAPDHVESLKAVADLYFMEADYAEEESDAIAIYEQANDYYHRVLKVISGIKGWESYTDFKKHKDDSELKIQGIWVRFFNYAREAYLADDLDFSEKVLRRLIEMDPSRTEPYLILANIADRKGDDETKMGYYLQLLEIAKDNTQVIINIAIDYRDRQDWENAKKYFEMFVEAEPNNVAGYLELAFVDIQMKDFRDAMDKYEQALKIEPNNVDIIVNAANVAQQLEDQDKFLELLKRAATVDENIENITFLCYNLARYQKWQDLITYSKIWHRLDPTSKEPVQFIVIGAQQVRDDALRRQYQEILGRM